VSLGARREQRAETNGLTAMISRPPHLLAISGDVAEAMRHVAAGCSSSSSGGSVSVASQRRQQFITA